MGVGICVCWGCIILDDGWMYVLGWDGGEHRAEGIVNRCYRKLNIGRPPC
jgi:hypothetical protein